MSLKRRSRRFLAALLVAFCSIAGCRATPRTQARAPAKPLTPEQRQKNIESFDYVWITVRDKHWDPSLAGLDWEAVKVEVRPKVEKAPTTTEARAAMSEMIDKLGQSHFGIIPASVYRDVDVKPADEPSSATQPRGRANGVIGIDVRIVNGKAVVFKVDPELPAARAGVKSGWEIERIGKARVDEMIERVSKQMSESTILPALLAKAVEARLRGTIGDTVSVTFRDGRNRKVTRKLIFVQPKGTKANFGNLPTLYVMLESRRLPPNVGYIALSAFFDPTTIMVQLADAMKQFSGADGIILDLRGNPGGMGGMAIGVGGFFATEPNQKLGTMQSRSGSFNFVLSPRSDAFEGPLAVLVDETSMSTAEILAGGLQDLKRARIFGARTPGAALPSMIERLPNGDGFQYAIANYISVGGEVLEARGVIPDEPVALDRKSLLEGRDPVIDAAVRWIESQKKG